MKEDTENNNATADYDVGYCKPPKSGQFKKGQSGNPSGRPRRPPEETRTADRDQVQRDILGLLARDVPLVISGKKLTVTTAEFLILKLVEKAKNNDFRSIRLLLNLWENFSTERGELTAKLQFHFIDTANKLIAAIKNEKDDDKRGKMIAEYNKYMESDMVKGMERRIHEPPPKKRY